MTAPDRPASFFNLATGKHQTGDAHGPERGWLLDSLADTTRHDPDWSLETEPPTPIRLELVDHVAGERAVVGFAAGDVTGTIAIVIAPSGWLHVAVRIGKEPVFVAYADRPYEEIELWPPGARSAANEEPPGRIGKRSNWVSLAAAAWPALTGLTPDPYVTLSIADA